MFDQESAKALALLADRRGSSVTEYGMVVGAVCLSGLALAAMLGSYLQAIFHAISSSFG